MLPLELGKSPFSHEARIFRSKETEENDPNRHGTSSPSSRSPSNAPPMACDGSDASFCFIRGSRFDGGVAHAMESEGEDVRRALAIELISTDPKTRRTKVPVVSRPFLCLGIECTFPTLSACTSRNGRRRKNRQGSTEIHEEGCKRSWKTLRIHSHRIRGVPRRARSWIRSDGLFHFFFWRGVGSHPSGMEPCGKRKRIGEVSWRQADEGGSEERSKEPSPWFLR